MQVFEKAGCRGEEHDLQGGRNKRPAGLEVRLEVFLGSATDAQLARSCVLRVYVGAQEYGWAWIEFLPKACILREKRGFSAKRIFWGNQNSLYLFLQNAKF